MTNNGNVTKATYQADIKRKQAFFNRCKRRYAVAQSPAERQFLKTEATRICTELKQCCKVWKNCGWGSFGWITRGFSTQNFMNVKPMNRKTTMSRTGFGNNTRTNNTTRTNGRSNTRRTTTRTSARTTSKTRPNMMGTNFVAW